MKAGDKELVGLSDKEAIITLERHSIPVRIASMNGELYAIPDAFDSNRRGLHVRDGKVFDVERG